ncbi:unnamed protein product [Spirodela intermedia]|uniref:Uncharacterized protein n=1 Tax=Spirodela intermedia TaxID=51605 RepID=A0ABN7ED77_SPIIN|nr:unnamed protein product [Spirodela intermedia]
MTPGPHQSYALVPARLPINQLTRSTVNNREEAFTQSSMRDLVQPSLEPSDLSPAEMPPPHSYK